MRYRVGAVGWSAVVIAYGPDAAKTSGAAIIFGSVEATIDIPPYQSRCRGSRLSTRRGHD